MCREDWDKAPSTEWDCLEMQYFCGQWIAGWAVGGTVYNYPADVGMRISNENRYLVIQVRSALMLLPAQILVYDGASCVPNLSNCGATRIASGASSHPRNLAPSPTN